MLSLNAIRHEIANWSRPSVLHRVLASVLVAGVAGPQLWAVLGPHEDWPFTSAPMFARYHASGEPLYEFVLIAEHADGSRLVVQAQRDLGLGELGFRRQFFGRVYGSTDPKHPSGHHQGDGVVAFRERLAVWMRKVTAAYRANTGRTPGALSLELKQVVPIVESRVVARYLPATDEVQLSADHAPLSPPGERQ